MWLFVQCLFLNIKTLDNDCLFLAAVMWAVIVRMPSTTDKKYLIY